MARTDRQPRTRLDPEARRAAILAAAADEFAGRPYAEVTVSSIARRAAASDPLLYRYYAGKEELYAAVVQLAIDELAGRQASALEALPAGVPVRDRVREATRVYLDHIASHPDAWATPLRAPGSEPAAVAEIRARARRAWVEQLRASLNPNESLRHEYALWGFFGFLDAACLAWVDRGCLGNDRDSLIDAALGSLEGALGDWAA